MKKTILAEGLALARGIFGKLVWQKGENEMNKNTFTCKSAFTMIELIFVIILIAILASIGSSFIPNTSLITDTNFIIQKLKEKQKNAIGYDTLDLSSPTNFWSDLTLNSKEYNLTCTSLNQATLNSIEALNPKTQHELKSSVTGSVNGVNVNAVCFDFLGRPYVYGDGSNREQLLLEQLDINISQNSDNSKLLSVYPISGYVKIQ